MLAKQNAFYEKKWNSIRLLALGHRDRASILSLLPTDIINCISQKVFEEAAPVIE